MKQRVENIESVNRRIIATLVRLEGKMDDLSERMMTKDDGAAMTVQIAGLAGKIDDARFTLAVHTDRLNGIDGRLDVVDKRLGNLERRGN